ncbi:MAG: hypothetical protein ACI86S_001721, partial [Paracoccaceae bacterium]
MPEGKTTCFPLRLKSILLFQTVRYRKASVKRCLRLKGAAQHFYIICDLTVRHLQLLDAF